MAANLIKFLRRLMPAAPTLFDLYADLDNKHNLHRHGITRAFFMTDPEKNARFIEVYFSNQALFSGRLTLRFFLANNPYELLYAFVADARRENMELAARKKRKKRMPDNDFGDAVVVYAGGRFIEPMRHYHAISKRRINGGR